MFDVDVESGIVDALIGFHAFSENHNKISSIFCKRKMICLKVMTPSSTFPLRDSCKRFYHIATFFMQII